MKAQRKTPLLATARRGLTGLVVLVAAALALAGDAILISDAWVPATAPGARTAALYFTLHNAGPDDRIVGASSGIAARAELHTHVHAEGMMRMQRLYSVDVPGDATLQFKPHGLHVMLIDLTASPAPGESISVTLTLRDAGDVQVEARVRDLRQ